MNVVNLKIYHPCRWAT